MALYTTVLFHLLVLATATLVFTQSSSDDLQQSPPEEIAESFTKEVVEEQDRFDSREGGGDEHREDGMEPDQAQSNGTNPQSRCFFSLLGSRLTTCNYTRQAGRTCTGCRTTLTCLRSNVGFARTCRGLFRYCRNGRCSLSPGAACSTATTAGVAATTTGAAATTAADTTIG